MTFKDEIEVPEEDVHRAYGRWCQIYGEGSQVPFWKYLKADCFASSIAWRGVFRFREASYKKLGLLLGPNHYALIKLYKLQNQRKSKKRPRSKK